MSVLGKVMLLGWRRPRWQGPCFPAPGHCLTGGAEHSCTLPSPAAPNTPPPHPYRSRDLYTLVPTRSSTSDDVWEALEEQEAEDGEGQQQQGGGQEQVSTQVIMSSFMGGS